MLSIILESFLAADIQNLPLCVTRKPFGGLKSHIFKLQNSPASLLLGPQKWFLAHKSGHDPFSPPKGDGACAIQAVGICGWGNDSEF